LGSLWKRLNSSYIDGMSNIGRRFLLYFFSSVFVVVECDDECMRRIEMRVSCELFCVIYGDASLGR